MVGTAELSDSLILPLTGISATEMEIRLLRLEEISGCNANNRFGCISLASLSGHLELLGLPPAQWLLSKHKFIPPFSPV